MTRAGGVKCWGYDGHDELGDGSGDSVDSLTPVNVVGLSRGVTSIAAGTRHSCALLSDGSVQRWGANYGGALGDGSDDRTATPVKVARLGTRVTAVAAGYDYSCVLTSGGAEKCWGSNDRGSLGDGTNGNRFIPVDVLGLQSGVTDIGAGDRSCALTSAGAVMCWGGFSPDRWTPRVVAGLETGAKALGPGGAAGPRCAITTSGRVKCWTLDYTKAAVDIPGLGSGVKAVASGIHSCALTEAGGVRCWGLNDHGQLGDGTTTDRSIPVDVIGLSRGVIAIGVGGFHSCAVVRTGAVKCWGQGGALGDGSTRDRTRPVDVVGFGPARASVALGSVSVAVTRARIAPIQLRCSSATRCVGSVVLRASGGRIALGRRRFSIPAGGRATLDVKLTSRGFELLVRAKRLLARARVSYRQPDGSTTVVTRPITLRAPAGL